MSRALAAMLTIVLLHGVPAGAQEPHRHDPPPRPAPPAQPPGDHSGHQSPAATPPLPPFIPPVSDADRAAAFPDVPGHAVHDEAIHALMLLDQLEWQSGEGAFAWDVKGWVGRDRDRFWYRSEGEHDGDRLGVAEVDLLYGRQVARWWDLVAGVRQDAGPGPERTWAAAGIQGLAPYGFDIKATFYLGAAGRTMVRVESEYELLVTNRLVLQPLVELDIHGKSDPARGMGRGLASIETGLRLRYEIRRELAPYAGVTWEHAFFGTADLARASGREVASTRIVAGVRLWR